MTKVMAVAKSTPDVDLVIYDYHVLDAVIGGQSSVNSGLGLSLGGLLDLDKAEAETIVSTGVRE